jgi:predicted SprT family Zn-dependent metalloprotease
MDYINQTFDILNTAIRDATDPALTAALRVAQRNLKVNMSARMTRSAGLAKCRRIRQYGGAMKVDPSSLAISLSTPLFARADHATNINTITHELAHIVDYVMRGTSDHGHRWQAIHRALGGTGEQYHQIDTTGLGRALTRYEYEDKHTGRTLRFTKGNHLKAMRYPQRYKYLAMIKIKEGEVISRSPALYALAA